MDKCRYLESSLLICSMSVVFFILERSMMRYSTGAAPLRMCVRNLRCTVVLYMHSSGHFIAQRGTSELGKVGWLFSFMNANCQAKQCIIKLGHRVTDRHTHTEALLLLLGCAIFRLEGTSKEGYLQYSAYLHGRRGCIFFRKLLKLSPEI